MESRTNAGKPRLNRTVPELLSRTGGFGGLGTLYQREGRLLRSDVTVWVGDRVTIVVVSSSQVTVFCIMIAGASLCSASTTFADPVRSYAAMDVLHSIRLSAPTVPVRE